MQTTVANIRVTEVTRCLPLLLKYCYNSFGLPGHIIELKLKDPATITNMIDTAANYSNSCCQYSHKGVKMQAILTVFWQIFDKMPFYPT